MNETVKSTSIQRRFSVGLTWVVAVILILFSAGVIFYNVRSLKQELANQLTEISALSALTLPNALWQYNYEYIHDFANSIASYKDVVFIKVSTNEKVISIKSREGLSDYDYSFFKNSTDYICAERRITHNNFEIGQVQIVMTRERIERLIINNSFIAIILLLAIISAIITTNLMLSHKHLFLPLSRLERSTKMIAGGDFDAMIDTSANDEIGKLAQSFSQMIHSIKSITASRDALNYEIDERKKAEARISESLKEKEVLLSEIHHRVKNNMQVIVSLLSLQAGKIDSEPISLMFKECQNRIKAMSLVHEKLYQSTDLANIDFDEYTKSFVDTLARSHGIGPGRIKIITDLDDIALDLENAIPCGLIINELVSNSLKYAFPDGRDGEIRISMSAGDDDSLELIVADNGIGMPPGFDFENTSTLGLDLTKTIVEHQLDGEMAVENGNGTRFIMSLKRQQYKARL